ncbi:MAG: hypothetical protein NTY19_31400 [Planctomycetota bacterium]|nr:hypothetical protein [Planctomycetota bacterium]
MASACLLDGQPLEQGSIAFVPTGTTSGPAAGGTISGGTYAVQQNVGPVADTYRVQIRSMRKTGKKIAAGSPLPPGTMVDEEIEALPAKYNNQSTLEKEVKAGKNTIDFELTGR